MEIWSVKVKVISKHSGEKGMTENAFVQKNSRLTSFRRSEERRVGRV